MLERPELNVDRDHLSASSLTIGRLAVLSVVTKLLSELVDSKPTVLSLPCTAPELMSAGH